VRPEEQADFKPVRRNPATIGMQRIDVEPRSISAFLVQEIAETEILHRQSHVGERRAGEEEAHTAIDSELDRAGSFATNRWALAAGAETRDSKRTEDYEFFSS